MTDAERERTQFLLQTIEQFLERSLLTPELFTVLSQQINTLLEKQQNTATAVEIPLEPSDGLAETVKNLIRRSGLSLHELGNKTNIDASQLSRFLRGQRDLSLGATERLCSYLKLRFSVGVEREE